MYIYVSTYIHTDYIDIIYNHVGYIHPSIICMYTHALYIVSAYTVYSCVFVICVFPNIPISSWELSHLTRCREDQKLKRHISRSREAQRETLKNPELLSYLSNKWTFLGLDFKYPFGELVCFCKRWWGLLCFAPQNIMEGKRGVFLHLAVFKQLWLLDTDHSER